MGDLIRRYESTDRLDHPVLVPEVNVVDLAVDDDQVPYVGRRKSSVRFLEEVTQIESDAGDYAAAAAAVRFGRSLSPNHKYSPFAFGGAGKISEEGEDEEETMSNIDSTTSSVWMRNRKEREARLQQNIIWLRDEIAKLKQQDQSLMRQFLQLRSVIFQLKGSSTMSTGQRPGAKTPGSAASESSLATGRTRYPSSADGLEVLGENDELMFGDDEYDSPYDPDDPMGLSEDPYLPEFRGRTVSLLNPANITKPRVDNGGFGYLKSRTMSFSVGTSARELDRAIVE